MGLITQDLESYVSKLADWLEQHQQPATVGFSDGTAFCASTKGPKPTNQDRVAIIDVAGQASNGADLKAVAVFDGIGGMVAGDEAASTALASMSVFLCLADCTRGLKTLLNDSVRYANETVNRRFGGRGGTTISAVLYGKQGSVGINVGDSRLYLYDGALSQLSTDDTLSAPLRHGKETPFPWLHESSIDNRLSQFVGMGDGLEPHIIGLPSYETSKPDDRLLLTTDGAHFVGSAILQRLLVQTRSMRDTASQVIALSEILGANDNATVAVLPRQPQIANGNVNRLFTQLSVKTFSGVFSLAIPAGFSSPQAPHYLAVQTQLPLAGELGSPSVKPDVKSKPKDKKDPRSRGKSKHKKRKGRTNRLLIEVTPNKK